MNREEQGILTAEPAQKLSALVERSCGRLISNDYDQPTTSLQAQEERIMPKFRKTYTTPQDDFVFSETIYQQDEPCHRYKASVDFLLPEEIKAKSAQSSLSFRRLRRGGLISESARQESCREKLNRVMVISNQSPFCRLWRISAMVMCFASSFQAAYYASFLHLEGDDEFTSYLTTEIAYGAFFLLDMVLKCLTEVAQSDKSESIRDVKTISSIYIRKGSFLLDLLALFPFAPIFKGLLAMKHLRLFLLLKLVRLFNGLAILSPSSFKREIKQVYSKYTTRQLEKGKIGTTFVTAILLTNYLIKTLYLIVILLCVSYFTGLALFSLSDLTRGEEANFVDSFALDSKSNDEKMVLMTYFAFTSLSTVGLGDLHPVSEIEQAIGSLFLLFGVMMTSFIIDSLNRSLQRVRSANKAYEETDKLSFFLGTLAKFNEGKDLPSKFKSKLEQYFNYRWEHNKSLAMQEPEDLRFFHRLPKQVQGHVFASFLYQDLSMKYEHYFFYLREYRPFRRIRQSLIKNAPDSKAIVIEMDENVTTFQNLLLKYLEPKWICPGEVIQQQKEAVDEIIFLIEGQVRVGYDKDLFLYKKGLMSPGKQGSQRRESVRLKSFSLQRRSSIVSSAAIVRRESSTVRRSVLQSQLQNEKTRFRFPLRIHPGQLIGVYETVFLRKSRFIYTPSLNQKQMNAYFIRKLNWRKIILEAKHVEHLLTPFKQKVLIDYINQIYFPILNDQDKLLDFEHKRQLLSGGSNQIIKNSLRNQRNTRTGRRQALITDDFQQSTASKIINMFKSAPQFKKKVRNPVRIPSRISLVQQTLDTWMQEIQDHDLRRLAHEYLDEDHEESESDSQVESDNSSNEDTTSHPEKDPSFKKRFQMVEEKLMESEELIERIIIEKDQLRVQLEEAKQEVAALKAKVSSDSAFLKLKCLDMLQSVGFVRQMISDVPDADKESLKISNALQQMQQYVEEMPSSFLMMPRRLFSQQPDSMTQVKAVSPSLRILKGFKQKEGILSGEPSSISGSHRFKSIQENSSRSSVSVPVTPQESEQPIQIQTRKANKLRRNLTKQATVLVPKRTIRHTTMLIQAPIFGEVKEERSSSSAISYEDSWHDLSSSEASGPSASLDSN